MIEAARRSAGESTGPACPLCGTTATAEAFRKRGYAHHRCLRCQSLFLWPLPADEALLDLYRSAPDQSNSSLCWLGTHRHLHSLWSRILALAARTAGFGPLLDVGCGGGQFLAQAHRHGWQELVGLEIAPEAGEAARAASGSLIINEPLARAQLPERHFALVTIWDVFEHLPRPAEVLKLVRRTVRPGGMVVISTPHALGLAIRLLRERAQNVMPPEHLFYPTRAGMDAALRAAGFCPLEIWSADLHLREWTSLVPGARSPGRGAAGAKYFSWYRRLTSSSWTLRCLDLANLALRIGNLGDQLISIARSA